MPDRIAAIRRLLDANPSDVFLHYSLAMELVSAGRPAQAAGAFADCIRLDPGYLPGYVEGGKALRAAGQLAQARELLTQGLQLAADKGERHTQDYIRQQLEGLPQQ